jgi:hypothetical protein
MFMPDGVLFASKCLSVVVTLACSSVTEVQTPGTDGSWHGQKVQQLRPFIALGCSGRMLSTSAKAVVAQT